MDKRELRYLTDDTPQVLPTFGNVAQSFHMTEAADGEVPRHRHRALQGAARQRGGLRAGARSRRRAPVARSRKFTDIWDKGKAAVIWSETTVTAPDGTLLWTQKRSIFARGEGGFGGERGPSTSSEPPERAPDFELSIPVSPQQALLYRMCGDRNPLHSDPDFAAAAGFPRPILHGLCTYGMTCKAMVDTLLDNRPSAHRTSSWPSPCRYSRRCCIGCAGTAIRCTRTRISLRRQGFRVRSCTGCARTA